MDFKDTIAAAQRQFNEKLTKAVAERKKPVIMICGYTGTGKTTLAQTILGKEIVPDEAISNGEPCTMDFITYPSDFITLIDSKGLETGDSEEKFVNTARSEVSKRQRSDNVQDHIHLVWYCIQGSGGRVTATDIKLIKEIFPFESVQVVITKNDITKPKQREALLEALKKGGIPRSKVSFVSEEKGDPGQKELVDKSLEILPQAYHNAFIAKQQIDLARKRVTAEKIIRSRTILATAAGLIPLVDILVILPIQMDMLVELADNYGLPTTDVESLIGDSAIATITASLGSTMLMDYIPLIGQALSAITAGQITAAFGFLVNDYLVHCSQLILERNTSEIAPFTFTAEQFKRVFKEEAKRFLS